MYGPWAKYCVFSYILWAENGFYIFRWLKKNQKKNILWHGKIIWNQNLIVYNIFYWNIATPICLLIICGCFCTVQIEWFWQRPWGCKAENTYIWPFIGKIGWPLSKRNLDLGSGKDSVGTRRVGGLLCCWCVWILTLHVDELEYFLKWTDRQVKGRKQELKR